MCIDANSRVIQAWQVRYIWMFPSDFLYPGGPCNSSSADWYSLCFRLQLSLSNMRTCVKARERKRPLHVRRLGATGTSEEEDEVEQDF